MYFGKNFTKAVIAFYLWCTLTIVSLCTDFLGPNNRFPWIDLTVPRDIVLELGFVISALLILYGAFLDVSHVPSKKERGSK
jgi:hypothetical protein